VRVAPYDVDDVTGATRLQVPRIAVAGIVTSFALGLGVGILRFTNSEPAERDVELAGDVAFAIVYLAPALLALMGTRRGASLLTAAGVLSLILAFVAIFSVGLIFVVPSTMFFIAAHRMSGGGTSLTKASATVLIAVVGGTLAFFALLARDDPICWTTDPETGEIVQLDASGFVHGSSISVGSVELPPGATEAGCSSDSVTESEAASATALVAAMLGMTWALTKRPQDDLASATT
jgi:hypothetical protein